MTLRNVAAIALKDLVDATRQGRVVVILLTPILIAVFYNLSFNDERRAEVKAIYTPADAATVVDRLKARVDPVVDLKLETAVDADGVRAAVVGRRAGIGFILPAAVEDAVRSGGSPTITVVTETGSTARELLSSSLMAVFRDLVGQRAPVTLAPETVQRTGADPLLMNRLGLRVYFVLGALLMVVGMIAIIVVPMILAEESEKHTLDALLMAGPITEVMAAKAAVGLVYVALGTAVILALTRIPVRDTTMLVLGLGTVSIALVGFGLLLGIVFRSAMQVSTWSGFFLIPAIAPAFVVGVPGPDTLGLLMRALPSGQAMRLLANAFSDTPLYSDVALSIAVMAAWGIAGYGLLAWRLARRES